MFDKICEIKETSDLQEINSLLSGEWTILAIAERMITPFVYCMGREPKINHRSRIEKSDRAPHQDLKANRDSK